MSISIYVLLAFLLIVSVWDIRTFEIPNAFFVLGVGIGFITIFLSFGWQGVWTSVTSLLIVFLITFAIWAIGESFFGQSIIGGGDMKLFMVISIFLGVTETMIIFYWSIIVGAFLFLFMIHPKQIIGLFHNIFRFFVYSIPKTSVGTKKIAFSVPITLVTAFFLFL